MGHQYCRLSDQPSFPPCSLLSKLLFPWHLLTFCFSAFYNYLQTFLTSIYEKGHSSLHIHILKTDFLTYLKKITQKLQRKTYSPSFSHNWTVRSGSHTVLDRNKHLWAFSLFHEQNLVSCLPSVLLLDPRPCGGNALKTSVHGML